jgi:hypothetical protein
VQHVPQYYDVGEEVYHHPNLLPRNLDECLEDGHIHSPPRTNTLVEAKTNSHVVESLPEKFFDGIKASF